MTAGSANDDMEHSFLGLPRVAGVDLCGLRGMDCLVVSSIEVFDQYGCFADGKLRIVRLDGYRGAE